MKSKIDFSYLLIGFMFIVYPLLVISNNVSFDFPMLHGVAMQVPPSYFYAPRYVVLALVAVLALAWYIFLSKGKRISLVSLSEQPGEPVGDPAKTNIVWRMFIWQKHLSYGWADQR
jgi:hypothetical protein